MTEHIKRLFMNSYNNNGWYKANINGIDCRNIKIGTSINCNDELLKDTTIISKIETILYIYEIESVKLEIIESKIEYYVTLYLKRIILLKIIIIDKRR